MKSFISYSFLAAAMASTALAVESSSPPVGYETVNIKAGFNYIGVRLHSSVVAAGTLETIATGSVTDTGANFSALSSSPGTLYILEINNGAGVIAEFLGSSISGSSINLTDNLVAAGVTSGASYKIRAAATLNSVFGANNSAGLATGFFGPGGDLIFVPNGSGGFTQYYYDSGQSSWADINGNAINGATVPLVYADGVIVSATAPVSLVVAGEVKASATSQSLLANAFNYVGSVHPAGATLASSFNAAVPSINKGFFGPGGDLFFVPDGSGGFNQYYYDEGLTSWADINGNAVNAASIELPSGVIIFNSGAAKNVLNTPPTSYSSF